MADDRILMLLSGLLALASCALSPPAFDEEAWKKTVADQRIDQLYAPHVKDGTYFNPWMPMEPGRFRLFLKWRLSAKADYTQASFRI